MMNIYHILRILALAIDTTWKICTIITIIVADLSLILFISRNVSEVTLIGMKYLVAQSTICTLGLIILVLVSPCNLFKWVDKKLSKGKFNE